MDASSFDRLTVTVAQLATRRSILTLLSTLGATGLVAKETLAACLADGESCDPTTSPNGCCSGSCSRKTKRCRPAFNQSTCTVESSTICDPSPNATLRCGDDENNS